MNNKDEAYGALAKNYEYLIGDCDYEKWSQYVCDKVVELSPVKSGADIACGSGYFTRALRKRGLNVFGFDKSLAMLDEAKRLAVKEGLFIDFIAGDIQNFKSIEKLGFVTAINDGFNYIPPEKLEKAFKAVYKSLVRGGVFLFDVSSEYKLKNIIGNNLFSVDDEDVTYIWFNTLKEDRVIMDLTFFERIGEVYRRKDESHVQYIHTEEHIKTCLENSGFSVLNASGRFGEELGENSDRLCFIGVKR